MQSGSRAMSIELVASSEDRSVDAVYAECIACIGRGELLLPQVALVTRRDGVTPLNATELEALDVTDSDTLDNVRLVIRGELPVSALAMQGAFTFV